MGMFASRRFLSRWRVLLAVLAACTARVAAADEETIAFFPLDTDPGWTTEGDWEFGVPQGQGSGSGDPTSGYTGTNVYGYNLEGDYPNSLPARYLTTTHFDCAGYRNVSLTFRRWLGVENAIFDEAGIQACSNGTDWVTVWRHTGGSFSDSNWQEITLDLSAVADRQPAVRLRWGMGPTDGSVTYPGWNIDDVRVSGDRVDGLLVRPSDGFKAVGYENGVIVPSNYCYEVINWSTNPVPWKAGHSESWLEITPSTGTLAPGETNTVRIAFNGQAYLLPTGGYEDVVVFLNTDSGYAHERDVALEVKVDPGEIHVTDTIPPTDDWHVVFGNMILGTSRTESITVQNTNDLYDLVISKITLRGAFRDDFDDGDADGWLPSDPAAWSVVDGQYRAESDADTYMISVYGGDTFGDLAASVSVRRDGNDATASGVALRTTSDFEPNETGSGYMFSVAWNGSYCIWKQIDGNFEWIQPWSASGAISNDVNVLTASIDGTALQFFINGQLAWSGTDGTLSSGHVALGGYTAPAYSTVHTFDDVVVDEPVPEGGTPGSRQEWYNRHRLTTADATRAPDAVPPQYPGADVEVPATSIGPLSYVFAVSNMPPFPLVLAPGTSHVVHVTYTPVSLREDTALLQIESNDADQPEVLVQLAGVGILDTLDIPREDPFHASGHPGGPFVPSQTVYAATNIGSGPIEWQVAFDVPWLDIAPTGGTLVAGESVRVTAALRDETRAFDPGTYAATIVFTNLTTHIAQERAAVLSVYTAPEIVVLPASFAVTNIEGMATRRALTVGNTGDAALTFSVRGRETGRTLPDPAPKFLPPPGHDFTKIASKSAYVPDQLLVRFDASVKGASKAARVKELGGEQILREYRLVPGLCLVSLRKGTVLQNALKTFNRDKGVLYAEPNYRVKALETVPDDARFDELWAMHNTGQTGGSPDADIDAPEAWDTAHGNASVIVAVIDTGVDYNHPDLDDNMWVNTGEVPGNGEDDDGNGYTDDIYGYDFYNGDADPIDDHGHGTHCSGTIGAEGDNGEGVAGVCWDVQIMALKFLDSAGNGSTADAIVCVEYATRMGAKVLNNSWGGGPYEQALKDAIDAAGAADILFVAAAGNDYGNDNDIVPHYPSNYDSSNVVSVMSTDHNDNRSGFSNYGETSVDLGAPGSDILSCRNGGGYQTKSGTSMATPHVVGACALLRAANPTLTYSQVKQALLSTVDPTLTGQCVSGGRMNLAKALAEAGPPWIAAAPAEVADVAPGTSAEVEVTFSAAGLGPGIYEGDVLVSAPDARVPLVAVPVIMTVVTNPLVVLPGDRFESSGYWGTSFNPQETTYIVSNAGPGTLEWTLASSVPWMSVLPAQGALSNGGMTAVTGTVNAAAFSLPPSLYGGQLVFSNGNNGAVVLRSVSLEVFPSPTAAVHVVSLDVDPGWAREGGWSFGEPQGGGSHDGDPVSGFTGVSVFGYNLDGDYTNNSPVRYLTSTGFDCSDYRQVTLSFRRWLGVEHPVFDRATIEVSTNGAIWVPLWANAETISDAAWTNVVYDISSVADEAPAVYLRWGMGPTDDSITFPGWNIDDIVLAGRYIDHHVLTVTSEHGVCVPPAGSNVFARGATTACAVVASPVIDGLEQYACTGWTGSGSVPLGGAGTDTGPIALSADSSIAWHWETNLWLDTEVEGYGSVDVADGWLGMTAETTVVASPGMYAAFDS